MKRCCRELKRFIARKTLLARRTAQVPIGKDATSGMGVVVETKRPFRPVPTEDSVLVDATGVRSSLNTTRSVPRFEDRRAGDRHRRSDPGRSRITPTLIGSIRRECLDHIIVGIERGLRRVLDQRRIVTDACSNFRGKWLLRLDSNQQPSG
jgi:hypothetical protein